MNQVIILGNLTAAPELAELPSGAKKCTFRVAHSRKYRTKDGQTKEDSTFVDVTTWARLAETCGQYLAKGRQVLVVGRLAYDTWQDKDGNKRSKHYVVADSVKFLARPGAQSDDAPPVDDDYEGLLPPDEDFV